MARVRFHDQIFAIDEDLVWTIEGEASAVGATLLRLLNEAYGANWAPPLLTYEPSWPIGAAREAAQALGGVLLDAEAPAGDRDGETIY